ncbi:dTMP kinase [bacterium]|nr:dTMP kinase [bacterium]
MLRFNTPHNMTGTLICVEGIDGSGKSTQLDLLYTWLKSKKLDVILTQWNSSDLISDTTKRAKKKNLLSGRTFSLLHAVDFADRHEKIIMPALRAGFIVLADRYVYTAFARDVARNVDKKWVRNMYSFAVKPDMALYFDVSAKVSLNRICTNRQPKFYEAGMDMQLSNNPYKSYLLFQNRVIEQYKDMVEEYGLVKIDALESIHNQQKYVRQITTELLAKKGINLE